MNDARPKANRAAVLAAGAVTLCLLTAAALSVVFWFALALSPEDLALMESPLLLAVARQLRAGSWELYGPFGGRNPLVLIHAPFYYRLAALAAWPIAASGMGPVAAALFAGRALSILSLAVTAVAAYRLARLDGARRRAGWWSALLLLASPVLGGTPFSVRPDMLGVALQTCGVLLVLSYVQNPGAGRSKLSWAFALFGLAICTKQHFVTGAAISLCMLTTGWRHGRVSTKPLVRGLSVGIAIVATIYCAEELVSRGRMSQAVFRAAANVSRVHPGGWLHVATVLAAVVGNSAGLIALLGAAALAAQGARSTAGSYLLHITATGLVIVLAGLTTLELFVVRQWIGWVTLAAALAILLLVLPAGAFAERFQELAKNYFPESRLSLRERSSSRGAKGDIDFRPAPEPRLAKLDACLAIYLGAELVLVMILSRSSEGAWVNYAMQAMVFAVVVTARAASRALDELPRQWVAVVVTLAAVAVPGAICLDLKGETTRRRGEHAVLARIFGTLGHPAFEYFFAERPGHNRAAGRLELVYDDWLYPVFESAGLAENRSRWLRRALTDGPVRVVVTTSEAPRVAGVETTLSVLGYRGVGRFGPFRVYEKSAPSTGQR